MPWSRFIVASALFCCGGFIYKTRVERVVCYTDILSYFFFFFLFFLYFFNYVSTKIFIEYSMGLMHCQAWQFFQRVWKLWVIIILAFVDLMFKSWLSCLDARLMGLFWNGLFVLRMILSGLNGIGLSDCSYEAGSAIAFTGKICSSSQEHCDIWLYWYNIHASNYIGIKYALFPFLSNEQIHVFPKVRLNGNGILPSKAFQFSPFCSRLILTSQFLSHSLSF